MIREALPGDVPRDGTSCRHNEDMPFRFARHSKSCLFLLKFGVVARPPRPSVFVLRQPYWPQLSFSLAVIVIILPQGGVGGLKTMGVCVIRSYMGHRMSEILLQFILIKIRENMGG